MTDARDNDAETRRAPSDTSILPDPHDAAPLLDEDQGFTAQDLIDQQARLEAEANEALPFAIDECTHTLGYIRQPIYACRTCGGGGVCAPCSVACHGDHELVELMERRHFRCDCGTPTLYRERPESSFCPDTGYPKDAQPCRLREKGASRGWDLPNSENRYSRGFQGHFCICPRGEHYDPETEDDVMYQCLVCEEWYHEACTALGRQSTDVPLKSGAFDTVICDACMRGPSSSLLQRYAGRLQWFVIQPGPHGTTRVLGDAAAPRDSDPERSAPRKRAKLDGCTCPDAPLDAIQAWPSGARLDVFLGAAFRATLCRCDACAARWSELPYVYEEEATYEPPGDDALSATSSASTYDRAVAALGQLPRPAMLDSLRAYEHLRDALFDHLRPYAERHEPMDEAAVRAFFREHGSQRRTRPSC